MKFVLPVIIFLYFLTLFQTSFLVHYQIVGYTLNLVLVFVLIWNLIEEWKSLKGVFISLAGGIFLDIFSDHIIGFNVLIMVLISLAVKIIIKRYVGFSFKL